MKLTRAQRVRLGAFVLVGMLLLGGAVVWLVGSAAWAEVDLYTVRFRESVSGLDVSSQVKYQGLRVGRVDSMRVAPDEPGAIEVVLALRPDTILYRGTEARLDQGALTGLTTINLSPGDARGGKIDPGSQLPAGLSFTDQITGKAESIRVKLEALSNQMLRWTDDENRARVTRLVDDVDRLVRHLDESVLATRPELVRVLRTFDDAGQGAVRLSHESTRTLKLARETVRDTARRTQGSFDEIDRVLKGLDPDQMMAAIGAAQSAAKRLETKIASVDIDRSLTGVHEAITGIRAALETVRRMLASVEMAMRAARGDTLVTLKRLRESSEDLRAFSRDIARDPSVLLRGREASEKR